MSCTCDSEDLQPFGQCICGAVTIGQKLSPLLAEIEYTLWENEAVSIKKPDYTEEGFRAAIKIFMSVMMDKMYDLQVKEKIAFEDQVKMSEKLGRSVRKMVKTYTDIDTFELYK